MTFESDGDIEVSENVVSQQNTTGVEVLVQSEEDINMVSISHSRYTT